MRSRCFPWRPAGILAACIILSAACGGGTETSKATSGETPTTTSNQAAPTDERDLVGQILDTQWTDAGVTQIYLIDDNPIGLTSGARLPLAWAGDRVSVWLGFADWSEMGRLRGRYDRAWDGEILLLEIAGSRDGWDRFLVRDQVPVSVPAGAGLTAAMCFENGVPHAVEVRFTDNGPAITQAWQPNFETMDLEPVAHTTIDCPDLEARPVELGGVGAIITSGDRAALTDECADLIDLSRAAPRDLPFETYGACVVDGAGTGHEVGLSVVGDPSLQPDTGWIQLEAFLGWDYTGAALWRVLDALPITNLSAVSFECFTPTGGQAVAIVEPTPTHPRPTAAWTVADNRTELTTADPSTITCEYVGD
ncbi:MAG: hypothetical protein OEV40_14615 [Acidimicrobiia bacterium]|nr:hypothetical protein [Acidimicrobiia bacterium]